jgi:DNA-binding IclR family transcriptional regulator
LDANPNATLTEIAAEIGRAKSTVVNYVSELSANGQLHKNGHGWEVTAG